MARHALRVAAVALLAVVSAPLEAQRLPEGPTYLAAVLTPTGALPPLVTPALLGEPAAEPTAGVGLDVLYGYAKLSAQQNLPIHTAGASAELSLFAGHVSVSATGAYQYPNCRSAVRCDGYFIGGASGALRLARWVVNDDLDPGLATLSLRAEGGLGLPKGGRARSAAVGLPVTLVGRHGTLRVVAFGMPQAVWGNLRIDDSAKFDRQFGSVLSFGDSAFEKSGVRFMVGGGLAVLSRRTGLGLHAGFQHVVVHGAKARVGIGVTWRSTR